MRKYLSLLKYEAKTILRDPINLYLCIFPIMILLLSSFVFPIIFKSTNEEMLKPMMLLLIIILLAFGTFFLSAMATFLLLEHKDENTLNTIAVTPVGANGYIKFKMTYIYLMAVLNIIIILFGTKIFAGHHYVIGNIHLFDQLSSVEIVFFAIISGMFAPSLALFQAAFARNKIEGFAFVKGTGMIALIPALMILDTFQGGLQYLLGIFPNFWAIKGMMLTFLPNNQALNLSFSIYLFIGLVYQGILLFISYRYFLKKTAY